MELLCNGIDDGCRNAPFVAWDLTQSPPSCLHGGLLFTVIGPDSDFFMEHPCMVSLVGYKLL